MPNETRMCPCGSCGYLWKDAINDLMNGPASLNREQAEARLEAMVKYEK